MNRYSCNEASCETLHRAELDTNGNRTIELRRWVGNLVIGERYTFEDIPTTCAELKELMEDMSIDDENYRKFSVSMCPFKYLETVGSPNSNVR